MRKVILFISFSLLSCSSINKQLIQKEIRGTVLNEENLPVENVEVIFYNDDKDFGFVPNYLKTNDEGKFIVEKVKVNGDYRTSRMLQNQLPSKIIFKKEGFKSDTIKIADYDDLKSEVILINKKLETLSELSY
ncbi:carboxypeptidase-like regulatory domain-containing protein [Flavobacterium gelidilacus]|uniref:carboxypeptidase-like regulatory domain-containing protein n=1 Tax=Flavobacterium gelidilacus TaxID=206041 RepID=UPI0004036CD8|nr:carboxypeptidase-like regulatory domain-containing protein [Flavobacterium gelidilacus]